MKKSRNLKFIKIVFFMAPLLCGIFYFSYNTIFPYQKKIPTKNKVLNQNKNQNFLSSSKKTSFIPPPIKMLTNDHDLKKLPTELKQLQFLYSRYLDEQEGCSNEITLIASALEDFEVLETNPAQLEEILSEFDRAMIIPSTHLQTNLLFRSDKTQKQIEENHVFQFQDGLLFDCEHTLKLEILYELGFLYRSPQLSFFQKERILKSIKLFLRKELVGLEDPRQISFFLSEIKQYKKEKNSNVQKMINELDQLQSEDFYHEKHRTLSEKILKEIEKF